MDLSVKCMIHAESYGNMHKGEAEIGGEHGFEGIEQEFDGIEHGIAGVEQNTQGNAAEQRLNGAEAGKAKLH
eukprot:2969893-Alexandrium_andersonii.AAC.1